MSRFVVADPKKCIGCQTCEIACVDAHTQHNMFLDSAAEMRFNPCLKVVKTATFSVPTQCRQCENAPCANACPNGSLYEADGVIQLNKQTCIGCKTCMLACPFGAFELIEYSEAGSAVSQPGLKYTNDGSQLQAKSKLVVNKCDMCSERTNGVGPACVQMCPTEALRVVETQNITASCEERRLRSAQHLAGLA